MPESVLQPFEIEHDGIYREQARGKRSFRSIRGVCLQLRRVPRRPEAELFAVARLHPDHGLFLRQNA